MIFSLQFIQISFFFFLVLRGHFCYVFSQMSRVSTFGAAILIAIINCTKRQLLLFKIAIIN